MMIKPYPFPDQRYDFTKALINRLGSGHSCSKTPVWPPYRYWQNWGKQNRVVFSRNKGQQFSVILALIFWLKVVGGHLGWWHQDLLSLAKASSAPEKEAHMWILFCLCKCAADSDLNRQSLSPREWATVSLSKKTSMPSKNRRTVQGDHVDVEGYNSYSSTGSCVNTRVSCLGLSVREVERLPGPGL